MTMIDGCYILSRCDKNIVNQDGTKGGCTENVYKCDSTNICAPQECDYDIDEGKIVNGRCVVNELQCTMPMYYSEKCYTPACNNEMGGCLIIVDYDKLNACGECDGYGTCDESSVVVAASISAGVVVGIVIVVVVVFFVGLIVFKKMYDMILGV